MTRMILLAALLGACSAQTTPETVVENADPQALLRPRPIDPCATIRCKSGYVCEVNADGTAECVPAAPAPECKTDADCRLFSDYCEGCNCVALGRGEPEPKCTGMIVQCFVDPCLGVEARCEYGSCVAGAAAL